MDRHYPGRSLNTSLERKSNTFGISLHSTLVTSKKNIEQNCENSSSLILKNWSQSSLDKIDWTKQIQTKSKITTESTLTLFIFLENQIERKQIKIKIFPKKISRIETLK